jgi:DNA-binding transcriptional ArsR family regulator
MQDVYYINEVEQAAALMNPLRIEMLKHMDEPRTCPELAEVFGETAQKLYYHVKALEKANLVEKVAERRVRGVVEGIYQAKARAYWVSPQLVRALGGEDTGSQTNLRFLLTLAEEVHDDIGRLTQVLENSDDVPTMALSAHVHLPDADARAEFLDEAQQLFEALARKYGAQAGIGATSGQLFRLVLAAYPKVEKSENT